MSYPVLFCGSRGWADPHPIGEVLDELLAKHGEDLVVVHGGARGADTLAHQEATRRRIRTVVEKADWKRYKEGAGPIRNQRMLDEHQPREVHAFRSAGKSTGTDDMVDKSRRARVPVYIHTIKHESTLLF